MFLGVMPGWPRSLEISASAWIPTIDGPRQTPFAIAIGIDVLLIASSACSIRSWPGRRSKRGGRTSSRSRIERSTYVLISNLLMIAADVAVAADGRDGVGRATSQSARASL